MGFTTTGHQHMWVDLSTSLRSGSNWLYSSSLFPTVQTLHCSPPPESSPALRFWPMLIHSTAAQISFVQCCQQLARAWNNILRAQNFHTPHMITGSWAAFGMSQFYLTPMNIVKTEKQFFCYSWKVKRIMGHGPSGSAKIWVSKCIISPVNIGMKEQSCWVRPEFTWSITLFPAEVNQMPWETET